MKKGIKYGAVLIGVYLGVVYFDGSTSVIKSGSSGISSVIAAFQGRAAGSSTPAQS